MRKLLLLLFLLSSVYTNAQDFNTLTHRAELLKSSNPKKALALYEKAINRVVNYRDKVTNEQWLQVSNAAADLTGKMKVPEYDPNRYRIDGEKFIERIAKLKADSVKCIFAYQSFCDGCNGISYVIHPGKRIPYFPSNEKWLLIWLDGNDIWMQAYGDNIYKPLKMNNKPLADFLKAHCNELPLQELARSRSKLSDGVTKFRFRFYWDGTTYEKTIANKADLIDPTINSDKYLTELSPQIQAEATIYYDRIKAE
ncbi:MAG: hypothetical protein JWR50_2865 [Mucilaginibacter sp.]|nr:hypothetical protein [Mucilaginibacter sp.]